MSAVPAPIGRHDDSLHQVYREALVALNGAGVRYLVGGAYAFESYTGVPRATKDFDIFVLREDCGVVLDVLRRIGHRTWIEFPHWLAKAHRDEAQIDVIYSSGNGVAVVDELWFDHAVSAEVLGVPTQLIPVEEMVWSKAFIMERERYDGADIAHLLLVRGKDLDWPRLVTRFGRNWRVLMAHLVLFSFIYPGHRDRIPADVVGIFADQLRRDADNPPAQAALCQGVLLSRVQYWWDVQQWGLEDGRRAPDVAMDEDDIALWTEAGLREAAAQKEG